MTISLAPPPLDVPSELSSSKPVAAFFGGLLNTIYQLWTAVYGIRASSKIYTSDDQVTGLIRIPVRSGTSIMLDVHIIARRTGGTSGTEGDSAWYNLTGGYKNVNGVMTGLGTPFLIGGEDQVAWNVGFTSASEFVVVTVLGALNNDIVWEGTVSTYVVGA